MVWAACCESDVGHGLKGRKARTGTDVCLIGVGKMLADTLEAADQLADAGVSASVWDPRVVRLIDPELVADAAAHPLVVTIEDGLRDGGVGDGIRDAIESHLETSGIEHGACRVSVLGMPAAFVPHDKPTTILGRYGLDAAGIVAEVRSSIG